MEIDELADPALVLSAGTVVAATADDGYQVRQV